MNIYLLRHGETEYNKQKRYQGTLDIPLSAEGLARLQKAPISPRVVCIDPRPPHRRDPLPGGPAGGGGESERDVFRRVSGPQLH